MSAANSSAKKRRAPPSVDPPRMGAQPQQTNGVINPAQTGLTLPQVIAVIDNRLVNLEVFMSESRKSPATSVDSSKFDELDQVTNSKFEDYEVRFQLIVEQIGELKDMLLGLQSFTMNVNQRLYDKLLDNQLQDETVDETVDETSEVVNEIIFNQDTTNLTFNM
jgi:hypothetical protein